MAEALQSMWQQTLNVPVTLLQAETKSVIAAINARQHQFAMAGYFVFDDPDDMLLVGVTGFTDNSSGWSDAGYDAAFAASRDTADEPARRAIFTQLEERLAEGAPYAPLFHWNRCGSCIRLCADGAVTHSAWSTGANCGSRSQTEISAGFGP